MILLVIIAFLSMTTLADEQASSQYYSFSRHVGSGFGLSYAIAGSGRITAVRVWEAYNNYIYGIQLRYGQTWSTVTGLQFGKVQQINLFDNEAIVALSGKYAHYVQSVVFTTNLGRSLYAGQPVGHSFNMYPNNEKSELCMISGRFHGAITSIGAHWNVVSENYGTNNKYL